MIKGTPKTTMVTRRSVKVGKTVSLGEKISGDGKLTYKSSDSVATVSQDGIVTGKRVGTATVKVTVMGTDNWKKATVTVLE